MAESEEETKEPLGVSEKENFKNWLEPNIKKSYDHGIRSCHFLVNRRGKN